MGQQTFLLKSNRRFSLKPWNCSGCRSDSFSCHEYSVQHSCPPVVPSQCPHLHGVTGPQPERHLSPLEQQPPGKGQSSQTGAEQAVRQNCRGELSLQGTGTLPPPALFPCGCRRGVGCARAAVPDAGQPVHLGYGVSSRAEGQSHRGQASCGRQARGRQAVLSQALG